MDGFADAALEDVRKRLILLEEAHQWLSSQYSLPYARAIPPAEVEPTSAGDVQLENLLRQWNEEQIRLRDHCLVLQDAHDSWSFTDKGGFDGLRLIAGMDTSFIPNPDGKDELAVAVLTVAPAPYVTDKAGLT